MNIINDIEMFTEMFTDDIKIFTENICSIKVLEYFMDNYDTIAYTYYISKHQILTVDFMTKYADTLEWWNVCKYQKIPEQFIEDNIDNIMWYPLSKYQLLTIPFIEKYNTILDWSGIFENKLINIPFTIAEKYLYSYNLYSISIDNNDDTMIKKLIDKYLDKYDIDKLSYEINKLAYI